MERANVRIFCRCNISNPTVRTGSEPLNRAKALGTMLGLDYSFQVNLVPRACDPRKGTRGSGIIRSREESDWPLKWNA
jgi:hypothetical protein